MKTTLSRRTLIGSASAALLGPWVGGAQAAEPGLRMLVGYAAGGSVDLVARTVAAGLSRQAQPTQVENVPGASGMIAAVQIALAPPLAQLVLMGSPSEIGINSSLDSRIRLNPLNDMTPLVLVGSQPMVLVANRDTQVTDAASFLAYVRSHPNAKFASSGKGTPLHLTGELIAQKAGARMVHVPYSGAAQMIEAVTRGEVPFAVMVLSTALPSMRDKRLQGVAVTSRARSAKLPALPALSETAVFREVDMGVWFGVLGPPKMRADPAGALKKKLRAVLQDAEVRAQLEEAGLVLMDKVDFPGFLDAERKRFTEIVRNANLRT
ncbi:Bug family tripartite tricarboxylate transporter substrate binding protein [Sphingomonas sp. NCPPB 2930]